MRNRSTHLYIDKDQELSNINCVKAVLMVLVILGHSVAFWNGTWFTKDPFVTVPFLGAIYSWLGSFHIYAFTLLSGYLFYYAKYENNGYQKFSEYIKKKFYRTIIPFYFVVTIWVLPFSIIFYKYTISEIAIKLYAATSPSQLWFLWMLFIVFAISWPLSNLFYYNDICGFALVMAVYIIGVLFGNSVSNLFQVFKALEYLLFFWIGFKIRQFGSDKLQRIPSVIWLLIDVIFIYATNAIIPTSLALRAIYYALTMVSHVWGAIMAFIIIERIANTSTLKSKNYYKRISSYTMPMYLFHQQIIWILISAFNGKINPYIHACICFIISMICSYFLSLFFMKWKLTRVLIGEKPN